MITWYRIIFLTIVNGAELCNQQKNISTTPILQLAYMDMN